MKFKILFSKELNFLKKISIFYLFTLLFCKTSDVYNPRNSKIDLGISFNSESYKNENKIDLSFKSVKVNLIQDKRKGENKNKILLGLIPLSFWGSIEADFPESINKNPILDFEIGSTNSSLDYYFSDLINKNLDLNYKFKKNYFSDNPDDKAEFVIDGNLNKYKEIKKIYTYGLIAVTPFLWLLGAPIISYEYEFQIELIILEEEKIVFQKVYNLKDIIYHGFLFYDNISESNLHAQIRNKLSLEFIRDIEEVLK